MAKTKREYFEEIKVALTEAGADAEYIEFLDEEIEKINDRAAKNKARREEKKAEGDGLKDAIYGHIGEEPITPAELVEAVIDEYPDVTKNKVAYRVGVLVKEGAVEKIDIKTEDGRKAVAYKLA